MINLNGTLQNDDAQLSIKNRGYNYGDALFETLKVVHGKILFWEDHYFRLMASMRILRMEIPMEFTMEFLEAEILKTVEANALANATARVRLNVHRKDGGRYLPDTAHIDYHIVAEPLDSDFYTLNVDPYAIELFKDYYVPPGLLSTLKTNNRAIQVLASIFAKENGFENCLLLNTDKAVVEAINGNLFLVKDRVIKTPPLAVGCLKGIMRKQVMAVIQSMEDYDLSETSISPFELQQADELFITNVIMGIRPVSAYRKKTYTHKASKAILDRLNVTLRLG